MNQGLVHLYFGEGKGKTTAAMGLAVRALAAGYAVVVVQFLKGMPSGEVQLIASLGAQVIRAQQTEKFVFQMTKQEQAETAIANDVVLQKAVDLCAAQPKQTLLILDEACAAVSLGVLSEPLLQQVVLQKPASQELVMTGREPAHWMLDAADYVTEMKAQKHPYDKGISARRGVEF